MLLLPIYSFSQALVTGTVVDSNGPVEFANVVIYNSSNTVVDGAISDVSGNFEVDLDSGEYRMEIRYLGYQTLDKKITVSGTTRLGQLMLLMDENSLSEVVITAQKKLVRRSGDKLVMGVATNELFVGRNSLEVLKYAPYLNVDSNTGALSMKGNTSTLLINGKATQMSASDVRNYLASLPSEKIKEIEIISNPSARYEASGRGGIINIITTQKQQRGWEATINSRTSVAQFISNNTSVNTNIRLGEALSLNLYGIHNVNNSVRDERRFEELRSPFVTYDYKKRDTSQGRYNYITNNILYELSDAHSLGAEVTFYDFTGSTSQNNQLVITDEDGMTPSIGQYRLYQDRMYQNYSLNYDVAIDSLGHELRLVLDYYQSQREADNAYTNLFFNASNDSIIDQNQRKSFSPITNDIVSAQLDYTRPIRNGSFEMGAKFTNVDNESSTTFQNLVEGTFVIDPNFSNAFNYQEQIIAGYASLALDSLFKSNVSLQTGVRAEYTDGEGRIPSNNYRQARHYLNLFPSVFLSKETQNATYNISYSRRINRPNYSSFNPTIFYLTDFTSQIGNPDLQPSYTHAFEAGMSISRWNVLGYYNRTKGEPREILKRLDAETLQYQWRNIDRSQVYGISVSGNETLIGSLRVNARASWYGKTYRSTFTDNVDNIDVAKGTFQGRLALNASLPWDIRGEIAFEYNGPETYGQFESAENYAFYFNLSKRINNQLSLYLNVVDPFDNLRYAFQNTQREIRTTQFRNTFPRTISLTAILSLSAGTKTKRFQIDNSNRDVRNRTN